MRTKILLAIVFLLVMSGWAIAQNVPPPPTPIIESDIRDNTIKMRSIELERVKREANKVAPIESTKEQELRFASIKNDFEDIQKLQDSIVKAYTNSKKIDYSKIGKSASKIKRNALDLNENLFGAEKKTVDEDESNAQIESKSVRDLIIELDNAIGKFIKSPLFQTNKTVNSKESTKAQLELKNIVRLSRSLSIEAKKMQ